MAATKAKSGAKTAKKNTTKAITEEKVIEPVETAPVAEENTEKTFTQKEVNDIVSAAIAEALAKLKSEKPAESNPAPVIQIQKEEMVTLMFTGTMANKCVLSLGELGVIIRPYGTIDVAKSVFLQKRSFLVDKLLDKRIVVVLNGLTDEEKERFGLVYKDGELLNANDYYKILDFPTDEIANIFSHLCEQHARTVAKTFIDAYANGDKRVTQEKVARLNNLSKKIDPEGLFTSILRDMGERLSE